MRNAIIVNINKRENEVTDHTTLASKPFPNPDVLKILYESHGAAVDLGAAAAIRLVLEPGWKWSKWVKPFFGGDSGQATQVVVVVQDSMAVAHDDGSEITIAARDACTLAPVHDRWVNGDEEFIGYEVPISAKNFSIWITLK